MGSLIDELQVRGDPGIVPAAGRSQHDLGPQPVPVRRLRTPGAFLQRLTLSGHQRDRHRAGQRHNSSRKESQQRDLLPGTGS